MQTTQRNSSHGTLEREGIRPQPCAFKYGIEGTRFLSENDVKICAFALSLGINPFPQKPLTPKEARMVRGAGFRLGFFVQHGGFVGRQECLITEGDKFDQCQDGYKIENIKEMNQKLAYANLWSKPGTIAKTPSLRADIQNPTPTHQNIQIQVNQPRNGKHGQKPPSTTAAQVLINGNLSMFGDPLQESKQKHVIKQVKIALYRSAANGKIYDVSLGMRNS